MQKQKIKQLIPWLLLSSCCLPAAGAAEAVTAEANGSVVTADSGAVTADVGAVTADSGAVTADGSAAADGGVAAANGSNATAADAGAAVPGPAAAQAASAISGTEQGASAAPGPGQAPSAASAEHEHPGREQIVRALQDDILFERQKRQLSNELALEKLRAELTEVRGGRVAAMMPSAPPDASHGQSAPSATVSQQPVVVLVSQVAGVLRVGVSADGQVRLVGRHETFRAGGKKYRLVTAKNNQLVAKEVE